MLRALWLLVAAATSVVCTGSQTTCEVPSGHQEGEFVRGPHEPEGGQICEQADYVEIVVRQCERRYCCETGCTCLGDIHETNKICKGSTIVELSCFVEHKNTRFVKHICCDGYKEDASGICIEKLDCSVNNGGCDHNCISASDSIPTNHCACKTGYSLHNRIRCYPSPAMVTCSQQKECQQECRDTDKGYECYCSTGYRLNVDGHSCGDIDDCDPNPCEHSGICIDEVNGYRCLCDNGYIGDNCHIGVCDSNPCEHGGSCFRAINSYTCVCRKGYTGRLCQTVSERACHSNPCENGGCCFDNDEGNGYRCFCQDGYTGDNCEIDFCGSNPCEHGGSCFSLVNGYTCDCRNGFTGRLCETVLELACHSNPCQNGGCCVDADDSINYSCLCQDGYTDYDCSIRMIVSERHCDSIPCKNGACCLDEVNGYSCLFSKDYTGDHCESDISMCLPAECNHDCALVNGRYRCVCNEGYVLANDHTSCHQVVGALRHEHTVLMAILCICIPLVVLAFLVCAVVILYLRLKRLRRIHYAMEAYSNPAYDSTTYTLPPPARSVVHLSPPSGANVYDTISLPPPYEESPQSGGRWTA